jgi:DNA-binding transcriptional regulator YiaG
LKKSHSFLHRIKSYSRESDRCQKNENSLLTDGAPRATHFPMSRFHPLRAYRQQRKISLEQLGRAMGVNKSTVLRWEIRRVPAERLIEIERATHGAVTRAALRPDLFPSAPDGASAP